MGEFLEPGLEEVPRGYGSVYATKSGVVGITTGKSACKKGRVLLRHRCGLVEKPNPAADEVPSDILKRVIRESNLHWLVEVKHIHYVVLTSYTLLNVPKSYRSRSSSNLLAELS